MREALVVGIIMTAAFAHDVSLAQTSNVNQRAPALESAVQKEMSRREAHLAAPIRSDRDMYWHLVTASDSPLNRLPPLVKWEFIGSLVFTDKGLASFRYDGLEAHLTQTDVYEVLSLFGVQHTTPMLVKANGDSDGDQSFETNQFTMQNLCYKAHIGGSCDGDHDGYECSSPGTCAPRMNYICTDNC